MKHEIERKFVIRELPDSLELGEGRKIRQGYIIDHSDGEARLRSIDSDYFLTIKKGMGRKRVEAEIPLTREQFEELWPFTRDNRLEKTRFDIQFNGRIAEIDIFEGELSPLMLGEIEFDDIEQSDNFDFPPFFDKEVTDDPAYRNASLAKTR